jgi:hypothetical protein
MALSLQHLNHQVDMVLPLQHLHYHVDWAISASISPGRQGSIPPACVSPGRHDTFLQHKTSINHDYIRPASTPPDKQGSTPQHLYHQVDRTLPTQPLQHVHHKVDMAVALSTIPLGRHASTSLASTSAVGHTGCLRLLKTRIIILYSKYKYNR